MRYKLLTFVPSRLTGLDKGRTSCGEDQIGSKVAAGPADQVGKWIRLSGHSEVFGNGEEESLF